MGGKKGGVRTQPLLATQRETFERECRGNTRGGNAATREGAGETRGSNYPSQVPQKIHGPIAGDGTNGPAAEADPWVQGERGQVGLRPKEGGRKRSVKVTEHLIRREHKSKDSHRSKCGDGKKSKKEKREKRSNSKGGRLGGKKPAPGGGVGAQDYSKKKEGNWAAVSHGVPGQDDLKTKARRVTTSA